MKKKILIIGLKSNLSFHLINKLNPSKCKIIAIDDNGKKIKEYEKFFGKKILLKKTNFKKNFLIKKIFNKVGEIDNIYILENKFIGPDISVQINFVSNILEIIRELNIQSKILILNHFNNQKLNKKKIVRIDPKLFQLKNTLVNEIAGSYKNMFKIKISTYSLDNKIKIIDNKRNKKIDNMIKKMIKTITKN